MTEENDDGTTPPPPPGLPPAPPTPPGLEPPTPPAPPAPPGLDMPAAPPMPPGMDSPAEPPMPPAMDAPPSPPEAPPAPPMLDELSEEADDDLGDPLDLLSAMEDDDDVEVWLEDAEFGMGLTELTIDCSEVTGTDPETGENNKNMCKFAAGMATGEISMFEILNAETVAELTDDLPDEMSGPISEMCDMMEDFSEDATEDKEGIENCQSADSAGSTAIVLFWISFVAGIVALIAGVLGIFTVAPHTSEIKKYSISISAFLSIIAFLFWIVMVPLEDDDVFGAGFYITIFSILILVSSAVLTVINSSKPTKTFVF